MCSQTNTTIWYLAWENLNIVSICKCLEIGICDLNKHGLLLVLLHASFQHRLSQCVLRHMHIETLLEIDFRLNHNHYDFGQGH